MRPWQARSLGAWSCWVHKVRCSGATLTGRLLRVEKSKYRSGLLIELDNEFAACFAALQVRISYHCPNIPLQTSPERKFRSDGFLAQMGIATAIAMAFALSESGMPPAAGKSAL